MIANTPAHTRISFLRCEVKRGGRFAFVCCAVVVVVVFAAAAVVVVIVVVVVAAVCRTS